MAEAFFARDDGGISAEDRTCHIYIYAETDFFKFGFVSGNIRLASEKSALLRAAPDEANRALRRIIRLVAEKLEKHCSARRIIEITLGEHHGIIVRRIDHDIIGIYNDHKIGKNILRFIFAHYLLYGDIRNLRKHGN